MSSDNYYITDQNAPYFFTFTVYDWVDVFTRKDYRFIITDSLNHCVKNKGLKIYAWCLMSNHLHIVCSANEGFRISEIVRDFKKYTSKAIVKLINEIPESRKDWLLYRFKYAGKYDHRIKFYKFWEDSNHAILLDDKFKIEQRINYTHENPVRAMIVAECPEYLFSSARDYSGDKGLVEVETEV